MNRGQSSRWDILRNVRTAVRSPHDVRDEGQPRGWERQRDDVRPPANNPPPPPSRPPFGYPQHYPSDPGPHSGHGPWYNSSPPLPQDSPPSLYNQNQQGQYQAGSNPQGYCPQPPPNRYQSTYPQTYGQNQGYINSPSPASHPLHNSTYQQQPMSSTGQSYRAGQGAYPASYNQAAYPPPSNSYSPPLYSHPDTQGTHGPGQNPNLAGPSYSTHSDGGSLTRTATAPPNLHCEHRDPGDGLYVATSFNIRQS